MDVSITLPRFSKWSLPLKYNTTKESKLEQSRAVCLVLRPPAWCPASLSSRPPVQSRPPSPRCPAGWRTARRTTPSPGCGRGWRDRRRVLLFCWVSTWQHSPHCTHNIGHWRQYRITGSDRTNFVYKTLFYKHHPVKIRNAWTLMKGIYNE